MLLCAAACCPVRNIQYVVQFRQAAKNLQVSEKEAQGIEKSLLIVYTRVCVRAYISGVCVSV